VQSITATAIVRPIFMPLACKYVIQFIVICFHLVSTDGPVGVGTVIRRKVDDFEATA
jgi:hypothetical protein